MALAKSLAVSLLGLTATPIEVEADISSQLPNFVLVGLPDASLSESTARVRAAITNSGMPWPPRRITVNLSPASVPKQGSAFDLSIALAILAASGAATSGSVAKCLHIGELGLDGSVRPVPGVLPMVKAARDLGVATVMVPLDCVAEARLISGVNVVGVCSLREAVAWHAGLLAVELAPGDGVVLEGEAGVEGEAVRREFAVAGVAGSGLTGFGVPDISEVVGQELAVRALIVAAAGGHHLLMVGSPGAGKTMLAERLPGLLPDLSAEAALESAAVASVVGRSVFDHNGTNLNLRPHLEAPHHSASMSAVVGGGLRHPRPGAISLAHNGVLFLDEAAEFQTPVLDSLRQPLEAGEIRLHRAAGTAVFPARFQLVLAANPCPCGKALTKSGCLCSVVARARYGQKLSGPLLDRVDIRLTIQPVSALAQRVIQEQANDLGLASAPIDSATARAQIVEARQAAAVRLVDTPWILNSQVAASHLKGALKLPSGATKKLDAELLRSRVSMRGYIRCLRLAWTICDLVGHTSPTADDVALALELRGADNPLAV